MGLFRRRGNWLAALFVFGGIAALLAQVLFRGGVLADSDILLYYYPVKTLIRNLFLSGHSLVWNSFLGEGQPLAANPEHELFYPFTWLLFLMPVRFALALTVALHLALGFWGMLRLVRRLRCSETAAIFGALSWSFGGLVASSMHFYPIFFAWTWIPWLCATALSSNKWSRVLQGALFGGLILLVGEPVTAMLAVVAFAGVFLSQRRRVLLRAKTAAIAAVLAAGIGAASWLPGMALVRKTARAEGFTAAEAAQRSYPLARTVELFIPGAFGNVGFRNFRSYLGWHFYPGHLWPFFWGLYSGALLVPLVLAGLLRGGRRATVFAGFAAFAFVTSLGPSFGIWTLLRNALPGGRGVRYPEKFLSLAVFFAILLAARGLDVLRRRPGRLRLIAAAPAALGITLAVLAFFPSLWRPLLISRPDLWLGVSREAAEGAVRSILGGAAARQLALGVLLLGLVFTVSRRHQRIMAPLLLLAAAADVVTASLDFVQARPASWMDAPPPVVRQLLRVSPPPRLADFLPPEPPLRPNFVVEKNGPFDRNRILDEQAVQWGIPLALDQDFDVTFLRAERRARYLVNRVLLEDHRVFSQLLASRHVGALLTWKRPVTLEDPVMVIGVGGVRPEVDSADSVIAFRGDEDFIRTALGTPGDLRRAAFIEGEPPFPAAELSPANIGRIASGDLAISFDSEAPGPSLVRIARTNDGNWHARVDGRPWPLLTIDVSMIGIALPPGDHRVEVRYRDPTLVAGLGITLASLLLLTGGMVVSKISSRARMREPAR